MRKLDGKPRTVAPEPFFRDFSSSAWQASALVGFNRRPVRLNYFNQHSALDNSLRAVPPHTADCQHDAARHDRDFLRASGCLRRRLGPMCKNEHYTTVVSSVALCYDVYMRPSEALAAHRAELRQLVSRHGLLRPRVFGSVLSGKDDDESDFDLLVDPAETTTLFTIARLQRAAHELLGVPVSVLTPEDLPVKFRDDVLRQAEPL